MAPVIPPLGVRNAGLRTTNYQAEGGNANRSRQTSARVVCQPPELSPRRSVRVANNTPSHMVTGMRNTHGGPFRSANVRTSVSTSLSSQVERGSYRVVETYPKNVDDFAARRFHLPLTTKASTFVRLNKEGPIPSVECFVAYGDKTPRFCVQLAEGTEMVNNITERGPCLYLMSPTSGEFEFQCQRDHVAVGKWIALLQGLGVKLKTFQDLYEFNQVIGTGSFGKVLVGRHRPTGALVCLKSVPKSNQNIFSFYQEIAIMRKVTHPFVVQIFAAYEDEKNVHMVMEYCPGGEVFDWLRENGPMCEKDAKALMQRLLSSLEYLHSLGIVHRDVKTENLLRTSSEATSKIKLIDFGLSAQMTDGEPLTIRCGSPGYVAPEILNNDAGGYGTKSDIFSAGTVLYTLLTGQCPFKADENKVVMKKNARCEYDFHHAVWNRISAPCKDLLRKMMTRAPKLRPSAREVLAHPWFTELSPRKEAFHSAPVVQSALVEVAIAPPVITRPSLPNRLSQEPIAAPLSARTPKEFAAATLSANPLADGYRASFRPTRYISGPRSIVPAQRTDISLNVARYPTPKAPTILPVPSLLPPVASPTPSQSTPRATLRYREVVRTTPVPGGDAALALKRLGGAVHFPRQLPCGAVPVRLRSSVRREPGAPLAPAVHRHTSVHARLVRRRSSGQVEPGAGSQQPAGKQLGRDASNQSTRDSSSGQDFSCSSSLSGAKVESSEKVAQCMEL